MMISLETIPNKHKSTSPTKEKYDKNNTITRRNPSNRYQYIFLGYFYYCNNFGHKVVHCKAYRRCNTKNIQRSQKFNTKKTNYNLFSPLLNLNVECQRCNNYGHKSSECRLLMQSLNIGNSNKQNKKIYGKENLKYKARNMMNILHMKLMKLIIGEWWVKLLIRNIKIKFLHIK